jgi:hypothetical protein
MLVCSLVKTEEMKNGKNTYFDFFRKRVKQMRQIRQMRHFRQMRQATVGNEQSSQYFWLIRY